MTMWILLTVYSIIVGILVVSIICRESVYHQDESPNIANTQFCYKNNSLSYKIVEILCYMIIFSIFYLNGFSKDSFIISTVFILFLALSTIDLKYKEVPDYINLTALTIALFSRDISDTITDALLIAGGVSLFRFYISFIIKKEALGEADIIIAATIGAMLGVELTLFTLFLSAVIALPFSIYARSKDELELPFIPFLAISTYMSYIFSEEFMSFIEYLYQ